MKLIHGSNVSLRIVVHEAVRQVNYLRGVVSADDRLLSVDCALGEDSWHRLRRGRATVQLVGLPAGSGQRCISAGIVAHADISRDSIACEMAIISHVRQSFFFIGLSQWLGPGAYQP